MIDPYADPARIGRLVVDPVRDDLAQRFTGEIVDVHRLGLSLGVPLAAAIAELPHQFLLFGIDRYHGLPLPLEGLAPTVDVLELRIPIRVGTALERLAVGLEAVAQIMEQSVDGPLTHRVPLGLKFHRQLGRTLTGPSQQRHRVATGHRIDQGFQGTYEVQITRTQ